MTRARHALYWVAVAIGSPAIMVAVIGMVLNAFSQYVEALYGKLRRWCFQEMYAPRARRPGQP